VINAAIRKNSVDDIGVIKNAVWTWNTGVTLFVEKNCVVDHTNVWNFAILATVPLA